MLAHPLAVSPPHTPSPEPEYPLPPTEMLTDGLVWPSVNREKNPTKQQKKRERERNKGRQSPEEKEKDIRDRDKDKDGFASMEFVRWVANIKANPLYTHLSRKPSTRDNPPPLIARQSVTKSLSTNDWFIAIREIKLLRLSIRINALQEEGRWSYRQPRRQKEAAHLLGKTHWDWLCEEGKWMRTDFREERKLKAVIGYEIGLELKELFADGVSPLKRRRVEGSAPLGDVPTKMEVDDAADLFGNAGIQIVPVNADLSGIQDLDSGLVTDEKVEVLDNTDRAEDALVDYEATREAEDSREAVDRVLDIIPSAPNQESMKQDTMDIDIEDDVDAEGDDVIDADFKFDIPEMTTELGPSEEVTKIENPQPNGDFPLDFPPELRPNDDNPTGPALPALPFENEEKDSDADSNQKYKSKGKDKERYKLEDPALRAIRDPILQLGFEDFTLPMISLPSGTSDEKMNKEISSDLSMDEVLLSLFPELKLYTPLPPSPVVISNLNPSTSKTSNVRTVRLIPKKDPNNLRRVDETVTKIAQVTKHMREKVVLVSTLNPGENFNPKTREWEGCGEMVIQPGTSTSLTLKGNDVGCCKC
jgi:chromatin modification-related protein VID21